MACFSSCNNWVYDVFPSFSGEDVRVTFLSHFIKELDRKLISAFKDNETERSQSLDPVLKQAIRNSRIAVVVLSEKYASSTWCLDELLEIFKCSDEFGQIVIPVFYGLEPSHVRKQTGKFGEFFAETCRRKIEDEILLWRQSLTRVANLLGFHSQNWTNEAKMIEAIANDMLGKLNVSPPKDFQDFVGMDYHIAKMSVLLDLESQEVRMVGIWGTSGIGKTSIGRVLFSQLSRHFQGSVFIDKAFVSKSMEIYKGANPDDYNMKLHLQSSFLSKVSKKEDIMVDSLGAIEERLKHRKVLIVIDDLEDQMVLDTLVGQTQWFGSGSRIIVITKDKQFLRAQGVNHIYEVCLPSKKLALEMFSRFCFRQNCPPDRLKELASEVVLYAGNLPLGLKVLGSYLRGRHEEDLVEMLPDLRNRLDGNIEKTLRVSYDGLNDKKDQALFRHIACLFNGETVNAIKMLLADSGLNVNKGLKNLVDKSLIHLRNGIVEMHSLLQEMGKEIGSAQSNNPGEREFLMDSKDICEALGGLKEIDLTKSRHLKEIPDLSMATNLEKLDLRECSSLALRGLKEIDLKESIHLKEISALSMATNLEKLDLGYCRIQPMPLMVMMPHSLGKLCLSGMPSLVELPSSIQNFTQLNKLEIRDCINLETLPNGINLKYLDYLDLSGCSRLKTFPNISTTVREMKLGRTGIEEVPWWIENFTKLEYLNMNGWIENFTKLEYLNMNGCSNLQSVSLHLSKLRILEVVDFTECRALSKASWNDSSSDVAMETDQSKSLLLDESTSSFPDNFINCFNYRHYTKSENELQTTGSLGYMMLTGEEVLPYFNHRATGSSLTNIPLFPSTPSPPFFKFKACTVIDCKSLGDDYIAYNIHVSCRFKNSLGNHFDSSYPMTITKGALGIHLVIVECSFPLNEDNASLPELNYDRVDIQFHLSNLNDSRSEIKGWGIRLSDEFSSTDDSRRTQDVTECSVVKCSDREMFSDVCEDNMISEVEHITESEDSNDETDRRSNKPIKITQEEHCRINLPWISLSILFLFWAVVAMFFFSDYLKGLL